MLEVPEVLTTPIKEIVFEGVKVKGRVWVQKEFVLSTFNGMPDKKEHFPQAITNLKKVGFNYVETAWQNRQNTTAILRVRQTRRAQSHCARQATLGGFGEVIVRPYHHTIAKVLNNFGHYKSLGGIYVYDEPNQHQFHIAKDNTNSLEQLRPDLIGFTVIRPSYSVLYKWDGQTTVSYDKYVDTYVDEVALPF